MNQALKHTQRVLTFFLVFNVFVLLVSQSTLASKINNDPAKAIESIANLRAFYFHQDFENGVLEGQKFAPKFSDSNELKAWYILNLARDEKGKEAIALAEEMVQKFPEDIWSWFALAGAMNWGKEKPTDLLDVIENAYRKAPDNPDMIWLRAEVLRRQDVQYDALVFIEKNLSKVNNPSELLVSKALLLYAQGDGETRNEEKIKASFDTFLEARTIDPNCVNAYYIPASILFSEKKYNDAYDLLKTAAKLAPTSLKIHTLYWQATTGSSNLSGSKLIQEIEQDMNAFLQTRTPNAKVLDAIARQYSNLNLKDKKIEFENRIVNEFNISQPAERILAERLREFASANKHKFNEQKVRSQYIQLLRDFTNRSLHFNRQTLSEAFQLLFLELKDDEKLSDKELLEIVKGMAYNDDNNITLSFIKGPMALLKRNAFLKETEQIVRYGFVVAKRRAESRREQFKSQDEYNDFVNEMLSDIHDMLGWIIYHQGRFAEAEKELLKAYELDKNDANIAFHLSQVYESTNRFDKAEEFYIKGLGVDSLDEKNPNQAAIKAFYSKRNGNMQGYEAYQSKLMESVLVERKTRVLGERITQPQPAKTFTLATLDGKELSLASLKGKVVVINFWGVWCTWCIKEMPEFQKLADKYGKDSEVEILTINNDGNTQMVQQFMRQNRYNFPVLLENGYNNRVGIRNYPTTWFIDKQGRLAYIKRSYTKELFEEFSWRIDDLKNDN